MTTEPPKPAAPSMKPVPGIPKPAVRAWSVKTLTQQLARYVRDNNIGKEATVFDLFQSLKSSLVEEQVGQSLDIFK